jgi:hypothetical protein
MMEREKEKGQGMGVRRCGKMKGGEIDKREIER